VCKDGVMQRVRNQFKISSQFEKRALARMNSPTRSQRTLFTNDDRARSDAHQTKPVKSALQSPANVKKKMKK
jgi:hypothetical protein